MDSKTKKEIREYEEAGIDVVVTKNGKLEYVTGGINDSKEVCDNCEFLTFKPDPDPDDWFRDEDQKAVCLKMEAAISRYLETLSEMINISKPLWCPYLGRELSEDERKQAKEMLEYRKEEF